MFVGMNYINGDFLPHRPDVDVEYGIFPITNDAEIAECNITVKKALVKWSNTSFDERINNLNYCFQSVRRNFDQLVDAIVIETSNKKLNVQYRLTNVFDRIEKTLLNDQMFNPSITVLRSFKNDLRLIEVFSMLRFGCVIWQPKIEISMTAQVIVKALNDCWLPSGVINLLHGDDVVFEKLCCSENNYLITRNTPLDNDSVI